MLSGMLHHLTRRFFLFSANDSLSFYDIVVTPLESDTFHVNSHLTTSSRRVSRINIVLLKIQIHLHRQRGEYAHRRVQRIGTHSLPRPPPPRHPVLHHPHHHHRRTSLHNTPSTPSSPAPSPRTLHTHSRHLCLHRSAAAAFHTKLTHSTGVSSHSRAMSIAAVIRTLTQTKIGCWRGR